MISYLPKRLAISVALVLTVGLFTPSVLKLVHALHGHDKEKHCVSQGTTHIHSLDFDCDFQDFNTVSKVFYSTYHFKPISVSISAYHNTFYSFLFNPYKGEQVSLRGPPSVSFT